LRKGGDHALLDALELYRAHLDLARSRIEAREMHEEEADDLAARVAGKIKYAESAAPPDAHHPGGAPSPAERSESVRPALRSLKAALAATPSPLLGRGH